MLWKQVPYRDEWYVFLKIRIQMWNWFVLPFPKLRKRFPVRINASCCSIRYIICEAGQTQGGNLEYLKKVRVSGDYSFCLTKLFCFEANGIGDTWYADQISELAINLPRVLIDSRSSRIHGASWILDIYSSSGSATVLIRIKCAHSG
jgi:hypothetical protein